MRIIWIAVTVLTGLLMLAVHELHMQPDGKLHVHFFDVGQGDATLLVSPSGKQVLIDGGPDTSTLEHLGKTMPFFDRTLEYVVLTHPDTDHLVSLPEVLHRYAVENVLLSGTEKSLGRYQAMLDTIRDSGISVLFSTPETVIDFGDGLTMALLWPDSANIREIDDVNDHSVVFMAKFKNHRILLPGDIAIDAEMEILASGKDIQANLLKIPHHGSRTSSSTGFLLAVDPEVAIASSGKDNPFGHPHTDVLHRYENLGIRVRNTATEGTISFEFE